MKLLAVITLTRWLRAILPGDESEHHLVYEARPQGVASIPAEHRGGAMSAFYIVAYCSLSLPAILVGRRTRA